MPRWPLTLVTACAAARPAAPDARAIQAYEEGRYARCAHLYEASGNLYNQACCLSLSGHVADGCAALEQALAQDHELARPAREDPDLDALRQDACWAGATAAGFARDDAWIASLNTELFDLYRQDLWDHRLPVHGEDIGDRSGREQARLARVEAIVAAGGAKVADDDYHAATVFLHGDTLADVERARSLAEAAVALEPTHTSARQLVAAASDRALLLQGLPQKYGTQYDIQDGVVILYEVDPATTDAERAALGVPTLAEARHQARRINRALRR